MGVYRIFPPVGPCSVTSRHTVGREAGQWPQGNRYGLQRIAVRILRRPVPYSKSKLLIVWLPLSLCNTQVSSRGTVCCSVRKA